MNFDLPELFNGIILYVVPMLSFLYGTKFHGHPPKYGSKNGFPCRRAYKMRNAWDYAQRIGGIGCFILSGITFVSLFIVLQIWGEGINTGFWIQLAIEFAGLLALIPIVEYLVRKKYPL